MSNAEIDKAIAAKAKKAKSTQNANVKAAAGASVQQPTTTTDIIKALTPTTSPTVGLTANAKTTAARVPTVKTLQGPVNMDILGQMNQKSASTGVRFESELANALKNKKK
jgi:hypothetical protein